MGQGDSLHIYGHTVKYDHYDSRLNIIQRICWNRVYTMGSATERKAEGRGSRTEGCHLNYKIINFVKSKIFII